MALVIVDFIFLVFMALGFIYIAGVFGYCTWYAKECPSGMVRPRKTWLADAWPFTILLWVVAVFVVWLSGHLNLPDWRDAILIAIFTFFAMPFAFGAGAEYHNRKIKEVNV